MIQSKPYFRLALFGIISVILMAGMLWNVQPERALSLAIAMVILPVTWGLLEFFMRTRTDKPGNPGKREKVRSYVLWASILLAIPLGFQLVDALASLEDNTLDERAVGISIGMTLAIFGNFMPKKSKSADDDQKACPEESQSALRFAGWVFVLAGLAHALIWLLAPLDWANTAAMVVVGMALALVVLPKLSKSKSS